MILSLPSFIVPGTYLQNVVRISGFSEVQGIELLFFTFDRESRALFIEEREEIRQYRSRFGFSIHMPDHLGPGHEELVTLSRDFVSWYIFHPPVTLEPGFVHMIETWRKQYGNVFVAENSMEGDFQGLVKAMPDLPVCCDTGHLLLQGKSPVESFHKFGNNLKRIHLHGICQGRDHSVIEKGTDWFEEAVPFLKTFGGVLHIEIFEQRKARAVVQLLRDYDILDPLRE